MRINEPCVITSRMQPGLRLSDGSELSIEYGKNYGSDGRTPYTYTIDLNDESGRTYSASDLQSGCQGGDLQEGLESLVSFLGAAAEAYRYHGTANSFPEFVCEWADRNDDELTMAQMELQESGVIVE